MASQVLKPRRTATAGGAVTRASCSGPLEPRLLVICCVSLITASALPVFCSSLDSRLSILRMALPTQLLARPFENGPANPWWCDPIRSASWRLNSNKILGGGGWICRYCKEEFQVLPDKIGEEWVYFNIFLLWQPKQARPQHTYLFTSTHWGVFFST